MLAAPTSPRHEAARQRRRLALHQAAWAAVKGIRDEGYTPSVPAAAGREAAQQRVQRHKRKLERRTRALLDADEEAAAAEAPAPAQTNGPVQPQRTAATGPMARRRRPPVPHVPVPAAVSRLRSRRPAFGCVERPQRGRAVRSSDGSRRASARLRERKEAAERELEDGLDELVMLRPREALPVACMLSPRYDPVARGTLAYSPRLTAEEERRVRTLLEDRGPGP